MTVLALVGLSTHVLAQDTSVFLEHGQLARATQNVATLGADLMGDKVNLFTGSLEFNQTDVSLLGNSALPVSVGRRYVAGEGRSADQGIFVDWDLDIPHLHGMFSAVGPGSQASTGWVVDGSTPAARLKRCSQFNAPPAAYAANRGPWDPESFWNGNMLYVPGAGDEKMLLRDPGNSLQPADGQTYRIVTKSGWQFRCITGLASPLTTNGTDPGGEGFIALSPDGTQYRFDWMATRQYQGIATPEGPMVRRQVWIMPTVVTDRFGNTVTYAYDSTNPWKLLSITASDGRRLTLTYDGSNRVASVSDNASPTPRLWTYSYGVAPGSTLNQITLTQVTLPDTTSWRFALNEHVGKPQFSATVGCMGAQWQQGAVIPDTRTNTITHPSGAVGSFSMSWVLHGRSGVFSNGFNPCPRIAIDLDAGPFPVYVVRSLVSKSITGPGLATLNWNYAWGAPNHDVYCTSNCPTSKNLLVTDPRGYVSRYTFGNYNMLTDGQMQRLDEGWDGSNAVRSTVSSYRAAGAGPYPAVAGYSASTANIDGMEVRYLPLEQRTTTQQGVSFTWRANAFDTLARPTSVSRTGTAGRTETIAYADNTTKWVLGQIASITETSTGAVMVSNTYDLSNANLLSTSRFGRLQQSFSYYADGTVYRRFDAAGRATTFSNYKRGLAQNVSYPDGATESAAVNDIGLITSVTDPNNFTTSYGYDAIGRLNLINRPAGDSVAWNSTSLAFVPVGGDEFGLPAGHWRQTVSTGNARKVTYFDALWRPVLTKTFDAADPGTTGNDVLRRFDADGRTTFESYPTRGITSVGATSPGTSTAYDALGRPLQSVQSSELGNLTTTTFYLGGFQKQVTNPRGAVTTYTGFQAFDQPSEDALLSMSAPEGVSLSIARDVFGKATSINRSGGYGGGTLSTTRRYVYDANQLLCKTIEPETGATLQQYDGANNIAWRASGSGLTSLACDRDSVPAAGRVTYGYDARNRLTTTTYGDGSPGISRSYTPDGLIASISSWGSTWNYEYNRRRLLTREELINWGWAARYGYDANGSTNNITYPDGATLQYAPNALGEPTSVGGYASAITHHPNGAVAGYTLGNGIVHSLSQNTRGLPLVNRDAGVLMDTYAYDANANVTAITNEMGSRSDKRSMVYDGLDRLTAANSPIEWGNGGFAYDPLDNLRSSVVGSRSTVLSYDDAGTRRLSMLNVNGSLIGLAYDTQGNVTGRGTQGYYFDQGNRLQLANGIASYTYDGWGRRTTVNASSGVTRLQMYGRSGQLLYGQTRQGMSSWDTRYVYLGGKLIAESIGLSNVYVHTDALGSPVARTNAAGGPISRTRYEPYGATATGSNPGSDGSTGIGFTGHVNDAESGLVYMQQRYYDPIAGRFLSVDPVTTDTATGRSFGRYHYANNNPYRFTDPDGRQALSCEGAGSLNCMVYEFSNKAAASGEQFKQSISNWWGASVAAIQNESWESALDRILQGIGPGGAAAGLIFKSELFASKAFATIEPAGVRFTQDSVKGVFRNGVSVSDTAASLRAGAIEAKNFPPIRLVEHDGLLFTLDNRRLLAFSQAGQKVPFRMATEAEIAREWVGKFSTTAAQDWGQFIAIRP